MNLQFIRYFITLAEDKNFTKAAEKNFVVQSTFSSGIKKLEQELDCKLFYRDKRNVALTKEGEDLLPKAKELLRLWNAIEVSFKDKGTKPLKVGLLDTIHHTDAVVPVLKKFKELYQSYHFELFEDQQSPLFDRLKKEELDIIFIQDAPIDETLCSKRFVYEEKLDVMLSKTHELHTKKQLRLDELDNIPFIEHGNCVLNKEVSNAFDKNQVNLNVVFKANHSDMLTSLVASNLGVSLMAKPKSHSDAVVYIPLAGHEFKRNIVAVWKKDNTSKVLKAFLSV
ncbi:LysR family transcriptional regulator [Psychroserpens sp. S379A]|uniref:LysR family transcriptional regulator n=1 Tax=Psychroserpens sp. S379A TaxID=3415137 RepID=UPI003C7D6FCB